MEYNRKLHEHWIIALNSAFNLISNEMEIFAVHETVNFIDT